MNQEPDPLPDGWIRCVMPPNKWRLLPHEATTDPSWGSGLQCGTCLRHVDGHDQAVADDFRALAAGWRGEHLEETETDQAWLAAYRAAKEALSDRPHGDG